MEHVLKTLQERRLRQQQEDPVAEQQPESPSEQDYLLMLGHCMRGLAFLGRGKEVESIFARVAIMPLIRSKVSMGRLDEGGSRGECAGLFSLLDEMAESIVSTFGPVLRLAEAMFVNEADPQKMLGVDLLTAGVWAPIATALMADAGIKMAIFSPGIASILQANYLSLNAFLGELAERLLTEHEPSDADAMLFRPSISAERIQQAQDRIYAHPKTGEFAKKWNLPIYYQLRFGDCCSRLNKAVDETKREGWVAQVCQAQDVEQLKQQAGFELSLFLELYDILHGLWRPDVILRPLTNRFLRGSVQLIGRIVGFVDDGMAGTIKFGEEAPLPTPPKENGVAENGDVSQPPPPSFPTRGPYSWGESHEDVAAVAWELTILDSVLRNDFVQTICNALGEDQQAAEIQSLVSDMISEAADQIYPVVDKAWNEYVVNILTSKCSAPLAAVKGVAATYRMTNRPPPTQASPFVGTILRPLKEFIQEFHNRMPARVGSQWKQQIVVTISDRYAVAVEELIATVQRTEVALNSRRSTRRTVAGGMRDGEKVKLQLYLDYQMFMESVQGVGVDPATVIGLSKLRDLTAEGETLLQQGK
jgi:hypothetical protein